MWPFSTTLYMVQLSPPGGGCVRRKTPNAQNRLDARSDIQRRLSCTPPPPARPVFYRSRINFLVHKKTTYQKGMKTTGAVDLPKLKHNNTFTPIYCTYNALLGRDAYPASYVDGLLPSFTVKLLSSLSSLSLHTREDRHCWFILLIDATLDTPGYVRARVCFSLLCSVRGESPRWLQLKHSSWPLLPFPHNPHPSSPPNLFHCLYPSVPRPPGFQHPNRTRSWSSYTLSRRWKGRRASWTTET